MPALTTAQRIRATVGVAVIFGTWCYLVFTRPTDWESVGGSSPALITLGGYVLGAILLLSASLPILPARTIAIIPAALVLNIVIGQIVGSVGIPLYLDSVGTVLVAGLAGPIAGLATGTLSSIVWGLFNPAALPFAAVSAMVGLLSGVMIAKGMLRNIPLTITAGVVLGVISGMLAAPVAAFVYGGHGRPRVIISGNGKLPHRIRHRPITRVRPPRQGTGHDYRPCGNPIPAEENPSELPCAHLTP